MTPITQPKNAFLAIFILSYVLGACSKSSQLPQIPAVQNTASEESVIPATTTQPEVEKKIEIELVRHNVSVNSPTVLTAILKPEKYQNTVKELNRLETLKIAKIVFNPNTSLNQIDVAPFLVIEFSPVFFRNKKVAENLEILGITEFVVEKTRPLPKVFKVDSQDVASPYTGEGYFPSKVMGIENLSQRGKGIKIAIIDTGFDFGHPMLKTTPSGNPKIVDYKDFTRDGKYYLNPHSDFAKAQEFFSKALGPEMPKTEEVLFYETLVLEDRLIENRHIRVDYNGDEQTTNKYLTWVMIHAKTEKAFVAVDLNSDELITVDEFVQAFNPKFKSKISDSLLKFGDGRLKGFREVLPRVETQGVTKSPVLELGFEENGHGTHVAGIAAGYMPAQGQLKTYQGVAPEAQVIAVKVCELPRGCTDSAMVQGMIYAAQSGADVINMSLGGGQALSPNSIYAQLVRYLTQKYGVLFVISAGNNGPGLNSTKDPGNFDSALTVGAYNTSESSADNYGVPGLEGFVFWWSSRGPTRFGAPKPSVLAPGAAVSSVPRAHGSGWEMMQGTSMAAPMATGLAALVLEFSKDNNLFFVNANKELFSQKPISLKRALEEGAKPVPGFDVYEQGYGLVNGPASTQKLLEWNQIVSQRLAMDPFYVPFKYLSVDGHYFDQNSVDDGLHMVTLQEYRDPNLLKSVVNPKIEDSLKIVSKANWISLRNRAGMGGDSTLENIDPSLGKNTFSFEFIEDLKPTQKGVNTAVLEIYEKAGGLPQGRVFVTDINSYEFSSETRKLRFESGAEASHFFVENNFKVKASENRRLFVRVPKGVTAISTKIKAIQESATAFKDARLFLTYVFRGQQVKQEVQALDVRNNRVTVGESMVGIPTPQPGIYEIIITGSTSVKESVCNLEVRASGVVSAQPPTVQSTMGRIEMVGVENIKEKSWTLKPVSTPWLMIEDLKFSQTEPNTLVDIGIGSTLSFVYNYTNSFRLLPVIGGKIQVGLMEPVLTETNGKPLVEDIDFTLGSDGFFQIRGPARPLIVHLYAEYLPKGFENLGVKVVTKVAPAPLFEVRKISANAFQAIGVSLNPNVPAGAFVSTSWADGFLGFSTPTATETIFVNGLGKTQNAMVQDPSAWGNILREILEAELENN